ncbi:outer membrane beta-barrel protein [Chitinophaga ginsengisoli]|uniref:Outer membrane protein with beta-barrel domain n=1 Tax=Chitinophaga ginsengisoli TaxID=363837 RepID=A0A2P8GAB3_9BACT|nr:outer membrane beta-barrel protein [Chitinophaga ginsengisoli]PSL30912.1 outer membrane protein with beta-barrel domain [Chitinophaga ginsengisoli]
MKKIILLASLVIGVAPVFAQTSVGIIGGYNVNSIFPKSKHEMPDHEITSRSGWRAGLVADKRLWKKFYLQPQLLLNEKGYNTNFSTNVAPAYTTGKFKTRLLYLELQANLLFKQQIGKGKLFVGAGPYIARGIGGLEKSDVQAYDQNGVRQRTTYYTAIVYRNKRPDYSYGNVLHVKPYDVGFNFLAGYELKNGLFFNVNYSRELNNRGYTKGFESKNTYFGLTAGYFLKRFS